MWEVNRWYVPNQPSLREWPMLADLDGWAVVTTWKSFGAWFGGAVDDGQHPASECARPDSPDSKKIASSTAYAAQARRPCLDRRRAAQSCASGAGAGER